MRISPRRRKGPTDSVAPHETLQILTEYVLHMSITSLGDEDIEPLYDEYMNDRRLGDFERTELTQAFHALRDKASGGGRAAGTAA